MVVFIVAVKIVATCSGVRKRRSFEQGDGILYPAPEGPDQRAQPPDPDESNLRLWTSSIPPDRMRTVQYLFYRL